MLRTNALAYSSKTLATKKKVFKHFHQKQLSFEMFHNAPAITITQVFKNIPFKTYFLALGPKICD